MAAPRAGHGDDNVGVHRRHSKIISKPRAYAVGAGLAEKGAVRSAHQAERDPQRIARREQGFARWPSIDGNSLSSIGQLNHVAIGSSHEEGKILEVKVEMRANGGGIKASVDKLEAAGEGHRAEKLDAVGDESQLKRRGRDGIRAADQQHYRGERARQLHCHWDHPIWASNESKYVGLSRSIGRGAAAMRRARICKPRPQDQKHLRSPRSANGCAASEKGVAGDGAPFSSPSRSRSLRPHHASLNIHCHRLGNAGGLQL